MPKLTLPTVLSGYRSTEAINSAFRQIEAAITNTVSRNGATPNTMSAALDMNSQKILNVSKATNGTGAPNLAQVVTLIENYASLESIPPIDNISPAKFYWKVNGSGLTSLRLYPDGEVPPQIPIQNLNNWNNDARIATWMYNELDQSKSLFVRQYFMGTPNGEEFPAPGTSYGERLSILHAGSGGERRHEVCGMAITAKITEGTTKAKIGSEILEAGVKYDPDTDTQGAGTILVGQWITYSGAIDSNPDLTFTAPTEDTPDYEEFCDGLHINNNPARLGWGTTGQSGISVRSKNWRKLPDVSWEDFEAGLDEDDVPADGTAILTPSWCNAYTAERIGTAFRYFYVPKTFAITGVHHSVNGAGRIGFGDLEVTSGLPVLDPHDGLALARADMPRLGYDLHNRRRSFYQNPNTSEDTTIPREIKWLTSQANKPATVPQPIFQFDHEVAVNNTSEGVDPTMAQVAQMRVRALNATALSYAGEYVWRTAYAGEAVDRFHMGRGFYADDVTGGDKGPGTINVTRVYENGVAINQSSFTGLLDQADLPYTDEIVPAAAIEAQMEEGATYHIPRNVTITLDRTLVLSKPGVSIVGPGTITIQDNAEPYTVADELNPTLAVIWIMADNVTLDGITIDGNRDGVISKAAWNLANDTSDFELTGYGVGVGSTDVVCKNPVVKITSKNTIGPALYLCRPDFPVIDVVASYTAGGIRCENATGIIDIDRMHISNCNSDGWNVAANGGMIYGTEGKVMIRSYDIPDQFGSRDHTQGLVLNDNDEIWIGRFSVAMLAENPDPLGPIRMNGPALSFHGNGPTTFEHLIARGHVLGIEFASSDVTINRIECDGLNGGKFRVPLNGWADSNSIGATGILDYPSSTRTDPKTRDIRPSSRLTILSGKITGNLLAGIHFRTGQQVLIKNVEFTGNGSHVWFEHSENNDSESSFQGHKSDPLTNIVLEDCIFKCSMDEALKIEDGQITLIRPVILNSGQNRSRRTIQYDNDGNVVATNTGGRGFGITINESHHTPKFPKRILLTDPEAGDDQDWVDVGQPTGFPYYSYNPNIPERGVTNVPGRLSRGQNLAIQEAVPATIYRIKVSGTRTGGGRSKITMKLGVNNSTPAAVKDKIYMSTVAAAAITKTNTGEARLQLVERDSTGAVLKTYPDSVDIGGTLGLYEVSDTFTENGTVAAGAQIETTGNITTSTSYVFTVDVSAVDIHEVNHSTGVPWDRGGTVGLVEHYDGSTPIDPDDPSFVGALPDYVSFQLPVGPYDIEVLSITTNAGVKLPQDVTVLEEPRHDALVLDRGPTIPSYHAGTGTISSDSKGKITGVSTLFETELTGQMYIKAGGQIRLVVSAPDNTHAVVETPFSPLLSGATFEYIYNKLQGKPTQLGVIQVGPDVEESEVSIIKVRGDKFYHGNLLGDDPVKVEIVDPTSVDVEIE